uniref:Squalene cyclase N-terminal domain-containing protein n=1 Tax=Ananas comosus var. bracteatus TaxID=296719 RepID=A0A6V7NMC6_ANACO|nr:unnamed protein product [Ananas comosus var. bracteatus]
MDGSGSSAVDTMVAGCSACEELRCDDTVSSYDMAWIAMVPSPGSPQTPYFPQCVDWMLQNQNSNGSWGLDHIHPSLMKDALSSTLACMCTCAQAMEWLRYIGSNLSCILDENYQPPVDFNIIFLAMLNLPSIWVSTFP